jgi:hydrogenase nickel incorporation protein HypA/HybF
VHEVSLAQSVLSIVEESAVRENFNHVRKITISIGKLAGVEIDSFTFALENLSEGTVLAHAMITIIQPEAIATCKNCTHIFGLNDRLDVCPECSSNKLDIKNGLDLKITDLIVSDE